MQRLAIERPQDDEDVHFEPQRREIEFAYVRPRTPSRGRTSLRQRSNSHHRSLSRESSGRAPYHKQTPRRTPAYGPRRHRHRSPSPGSPIRRLVCGGSPARVAEPGPSRYRQRSTERDLSPGKDGGWDFGGRVRHVRVSERLG